ncbi:hypothetical protein D9M69_722520 [compost metagenome]
MLDDGMRQRMLAALVEACGQAQNLDRVERPGSLCTMKGRPPLGQCPGLVDDQGVDFAEVLDSAGIAE